MRLVDIDARECWACTHHCKDGGCSVWCENGEAFEFRADLKEATIVESVPAKGILEVGGAVDVLFSHNEIVALWHEQGEERGTKYLLWRGMAWDIPKQYKTMPVIRFFGTIPQRFSESDTINIIIELPECGEKLK